MADKYYILKISLNDIAIAEPFLPSYSVLGFCF